MSRACAMFGLFLAACRLGQSPPPDPLAGHLQGTCEGEPGWVTVLAMDLALDGDFSSEGAATVDLGFGAEPGTARLLQPVDPDKGPGDRYEHPFWGATLVVTADEGAWQVWGDLWWDHEEVAFHGDCAIDDDGTFVYDEPSWSWGSNWVEGRWDGTDAGIESFASDLFGLDGARVLEGGGEIQLGIDDGPLADGVAMSGFREDAGEDTAGTTDECAIEAEAADACERVTVEGTVGGLEYVGEKVVYRTYSEGSLALVRLDWSDDLISDEDWTYTWSDTGDVAVIAQQTCGSTAVEEHTIQYDSRGSELVDTWTAPYSAEGRCVYENEYDGDRRIVSTASCSQYCTVGGEEEWTIVTRYDDQGRPTELVQQEEGCGSLMRVEAYTYADCE